MTTRKYARGIPCRMILVNVEYAIRERFSRKGRKEWMVMYLLPRETEWKSLAVHTDQKRAEYHLARMLKNQKRYDAAVVKSLEGIPLDDDLTDFD